MTGMGFHSDGEFFLYQDLPDLDGEVAAAREEVAADPADPDRRLSPLANCFTAREARRKKPTSRPTEAARLYRLRLKASPNDARLLTRLSQSLQATAGTGNPPPAAGCPSSRPGKRKPGWPWAILQRPGPRRVVRRQDRQGLQGQAGGAPEDGPQALPRRGTPRPSVERVLEEARAALPAAGRSTARPAPARGCGSPSPGRRCSAAACAGPAASGRSTRWPRCSRPVPPLFPPRRRVEPRRLSRRRLGRLVRGSAATPWATAPG